MHADHLPVLRPIVLEEVEIALLRLEREACAMACAEAARVRLAQALQPELNSYVQNWRLQTAAVLQACLLSESEAPCVLRRAFASECGQWPLASELAIAAWELQPNEAHHALVVHACLAEGRTEDANAWSQSLAPCRWPAVLSSVKQSGRVEVLDGARG